MARRCSRGKPRMDTNEHEWGRGVLNISSGGHPGCPEKASASSGDWNNLERHPAAVLFSAGPEARLYGRQGCLPPIRTLRRFGNRRHSRFGNLRYETMLSVLRIRVYSCSFVVKQ